MSKFIGWLAGILAAVIGGWILWYVTKPPATTTFEGMVINSTANAPVSGALVSVNVKGAPGSEPYHDFTDEHGSYRIDFTGLGQSSGATVQVQAKDFQPSQPDVIATVTMDNRHDFLLKPLAPKPPPAPGASIAHLPPVAMLKYVPKTTKQAVHIQFR